MLVETRHGVGTFVLERDERHGLHLTHDTAASVRGILELRMGLETQAAALAALRRTDEQLQQMRQALDDYQDSLANNDSAVEPDVRFHRLIAQATGNTYFTDVIYHLGHSVIPRTRINAEERGDADLMELGRLANQPGTRRRQKSTTPSSSRSAICGPANPTGPTRNWRPSRLRS